MLLNRTVAEKGRFPEPGRWFCAAFLPCVILSLWQCGVGHFLLFGKRWPDMNLPKRNSADGRCYWMK
ncbi:MAG: hypothetical protein KH028_04995, partial [Oscillospiraceae bacterium]|nr:hypothetical protein [Oscillospiraceae bacterium]